MCSELFPQSERSAIAVLDMTQMGVVGTDAAIPRLPNQNGENDFSLAIGLCVLHKKVELGILCLQTRCMQTAFAKPSCEETLCIPHLKGNTPLSPSNSSQSAQSPPGYPGWPAPPSYYGIQSMEYASNWKSDRQNRYTKIVLLLIEASLLRSSPTNVPGFNCI